MSGMGATSGGARATAAVYGIGVVEDRHGAGPAQGSLIQGFPGLGVQLGSTEFWIWALFGAAVVWMLGVAWLMRAARV